MFVPSGGAGRSAAGLVLRCHRIARKRRALQGGQQCMQRYTFVHRRLQAGEASPGRRIAAAAVGCGKFCTGRAVHAGPNEPLICDWTAKGRLPKTCDRTFLPARQATRPVRDPLPPGCFRPAAPDCWPPRCWRLPRRRARRGRKISRAGTATPGPRPRMGAGIKAMKGADRQMSEGRPWAVTPGTAILKAAPAVPILWAARPPATCRRWATPATCLSTKRPPATRPLMTPPA